MSIAERLDNHGKGAWIGLMILSFIVFWPVGLFMLCYMLWSGRMGCWTKSGVARRKDSGSGVSSGPGRWYSAAAAYKSSGNRAFDEYREATLRRLEEEKEEFVEYMEKLRQARDKEEFERFMADRQKNKDVETTASEVEDAKPA